LQQVKRYQQLRQRRILKTLLSHLRELRLFLQETLPAAFSLMRLFKRENPHLIHLGNGFRANLDGIIAAWWIGIPCVCHVKGFERYSWLDRLFARAVDLGICMTVAIQEHCEGHGVSAKRMIVIYDGLDVEDFRPARDSSAVRQMLGIPLEAPLVGIVGHIQEWKGQAVVVEAIRQVREVLPDIYCLIVGGVHDNGKAYARDLHRAVEEHGLQSQVRFTGSRDDVADLVAAMDIVIHASIRPEPFGRVIIEGMALGKAVIATKMGGVPEFVQDSVTGKLVPPNDHQVLARTIVALLEDASYRTYLGNNGREEVERRFTMQRHVMEVTDAYVSCEMTTHF
jgi:glycosyltransferase involved in cell wall biosynthesis